MFGIFETFSIILYGFMWFV